MTFRRIGGVCKTRVYLFWRAKVRYCFIAGIVSLPLLLYWFIAGIVLLLLLLHCWYCCIDTNGMNYLLRTGKTQPSNIVSNGTMPAIHQSFIHFGLIVHSSVAKPPASKCCISMRWWPPSETVTSSVSGSCTFQCSMTGLPSRKSRTPSSEVSVITY